MKLINVLYENNTLSITKNYSREFGEIYLKDLVNNGILANLFTQIEKNFPDLKDQLQQTFILSNQLLSYIKPEKGEEVYKLSTLGNEEALYLLDELKELIKYIQTSVERIDTLADYDDEKEVNKIVKDIKSHFEDILAIFTSNVRGDEPLQPYKQTGKIGFTELKKIKKMNYKTKLTRLKESVRKQINKLKLERFEDDFIDKQIDQKIKFCDCACSGGGSTFVSGYGTPTQNGGCDCRGRTAYYNSFPDGRYDGTECVAVRPGRGPMQIFTKN